MLSCNTACLQKAGLSYEDGDEGAPVKASVNTSGNEDFKGGEDNCSSKERVCNKILEEARQSAGIVENQDRLLGEGLQQINPQGN